MVGTAVFGAPRFCIKTLKNAVFSRALAKNRGAPKMAVPTTTHPIPQLTPTPKKANSVVGLELADMGPLRCAPAWYGPFRPTTKDAPQGAVAKGAVAKCCCCCRVHAARSQGRCCLLHLCPSQFPQTDASVHFGRPLKST